MVQPFCRAQRRARHREHAIRATSVAIGRNPHPALLTVLAMQMYNETFSNAHLSQSINQSSDSNVLNAEKYLLIYYKRPLE